MSARRSDSTAFISVARECGRRLCRCTMVIVRVDGYIQARCLVNSGGSKGDTPPTRGDFLGACGRAHWWERRRCRSHSVIVSVDEYQNGRGCDPADRRRVHDCRTRPRAGAEAKNGNTRRVCREVRRSVGRGPRGRQGVRRLPAGCGSRAHRRRWHPGRASPGRVARKGAHHCPE